MKAAIIIPARFASSRLPGKPLLSQTGKTLIQHTYERAMLANNTSQVIVATDDQRIFNAVEYFGGKVVMTSQDHETGSARAAEVAAKIDAEIIVNLQGDEPEIDSAHIDFLIDILSRHDCFAATLACPFDESAVDGPGSPQDPSAVKAILSKVLSDNVHRAHYFTRSLCAYPRDADSAIIDPQRYHLHIGIYAFRRDSLMRFAAQPVGALEKIERLEQLRILEMGETIAVGMVSAAPAGIDTPEDYQAFVERCAKAQT
ncbi:MAG: 3-deoxy-manno-octulosonate cytidylyltransferase [Marinicaulis sp.]|nr:3-deoxy-manno-octulosonate cytidylyltransferase [Marinicaulis sp.]